MGYAYRDRPAPGGAIRFDQRGSERALVFTRTDRANEAERGFKKILTGPEHPDYLPFCQGPGHGTGYQDQIIIEAKDFLSSGRDRQGPVWPTFQEGLEVNRVIAAAHASLRKARGWMRLIEDF